MSDACACPTTCRAFSVLLLRRWAWNANSADTGGLVTSPNWDKVHWRKIEWLIRSTDMSPWYLVRSLDA